MAMEAGAGEMNTRIRFLRIQNGARRDIDSTAEADVFDEPVYCKWVWSHGTESLENYSLQLGQVAKLTMYYSPLINTQMRVVLEDEEALLGTDGGPFEIIGINPVLNQGRFMEIDVKR